MEGVTFTPGERITHPEFGAGVVLDAPRDGFLRAFFSTGERRVPLANIRRELSRTERILSSVEGNRAVILTAPTHAEIASRVAARREAVSREISRLADTGILDRHGRDLIITDVAALRGGVEAVLDITPT